MEAVLNMAKRKPSPKAEVNRLRAAVTFIRSTEEWKGWIERLAEHDRASSVAELMDRAVVQYAKKVKFDEPPPRR
jgi:hypothetical protein